MKEEYKEIKVEEAVERLHMPAEKIQSLIKLSLNGDMLQTAEQAFIEGDLEKARMAIHTIKGTAANVGLVGLSELALEIEIKIKETNYLDFELLSVMKDVWAELKNITEC